MGRARGIFVFLLFVSSCFSINGVWKDICEDDKCYGGTMSLCLVNDNQVFGRYSDIGFVLGTLTSSSSIEGVWYEAGYSQKNHGGFKWLLMDNNASQFTGSWWYANQKCEKFGWASEKIDSDQPLLTECGIPALDNFDSLLGGYWIHEQDEMWLCEDEREYFHGSGRFSDGYDSVDLNIAGKSYLNRKVSSGSYWKQGETSGIMLFNLITQEDMVVSWWDVEINQFALGRFNEFNLHSSALFKRGSPVGARLEDECKSNQNIGGLGWQGSWFDTRYGNGRFYTCPTDDNLLDGIFSELGWVEAQINDDEISGSYYVSGARTDVDDGQFQLQLTNNGHSFEGVYLVQGELVEWKQDRVDATSAYSSNCFVPSSGSIAGQWFYGKSSLDMMDICIDDDGMVEMSYSYNRGESQGYAVGFTSESGPQSIRVTFFEKRASGIAMYRLVDERHMMEFFWEDIDVSFELDFDICEKNALNFDYWGRHSVNRLKLMTPQVSEVRCARNSHLFDKDVFEVDLNSSSSFLFPSLFSLLFAMGFFLF